MQELDFSGLNKIAFKGFETEEAREERDSLLQAGYTIVDSPENPFTASAPVESSAAQRTPSERKREAFTDHTGGRDYKRLYRAAHDFHQRHNPPEVVRDYWKDHRPGEDDIPEAEAQYWTRAAQDIAETSAAGNNDPFLMALLSAVYEELEREYNALRAEISGGVSG